MKFSVKSVGCYGKLLIDDTQHLFIASAYILQGDYEKGKKVIEDRFSKPGL